MSDFETVLEYLNKARQDLAKINSYVSDLQPLQIEIRGQEIRMEQVTIDAEAGATTVIVFNPADNIWPWFVIENGPDHHSVNLECSKYWITGERNKTSTAEVLCAVRGFVSQWEQACSGDAIRSPGTTSA